ncbi:sigma-70 family RNA polymerase sigma factor [Caulobacter sp. DWR1-3-2b1]|uniref:sigma-70 family RNA polymerase sigma factor n=1 Tax=Caulobacter sp. DWR1-3-2b1 TaxID=2804670 RepID=UPI003CF6A17F
MTDRSELRAAPDSESLDAEAALWRAFGETRAQGARERLFNRHMDFAKMVAARHFRRGRAPDIELLELRQLAYAGLLEAIDRFDPAQGAPFRGYAARRIMGSILNGVAKLSELREQISFRSRVRADRLRSLTANGMGQADAADALQALTDLAVGLAIGFMLDGSGLVAAPGEADPAPSAYDSLVWRDMLRRLTNEIAALPERERLIVRGHYLDGVDFESLARLLQISKGRVSQLHKAALGRIRAQLARADVFSFRP